MAGIGDVLGKMFSGIAGGPDGTHIKVWNELKPWLATLGPSAARKWLPQIAAGTLCEVPVMRRGTRHECDNFGIATCDVCHRPVCLEHGRIDQNGDAICYLCVAEAMQVLPPLQRERARQEGQQRRPGEQRYRGRPEDQQQRPHQQQPPPGQAPPKPRVDPKKIAWATEVLGLSPGATWDDVLKAHRNLSAKHHPDRHMRSSEKKRASEEARYKEVQVAYDVLKTVMGKVG